MSRLKRTRICRRSGIDLSIYLVTDGKQIPAGCGRGLVETVTAAVAGGVTAVQIREKGSDARAMLDLALALDERLPGGVALIVNDRVDVFMAARLRGIELTGVHVGQRDLPVSEVRALIGPDPLIGLTVSNRSQVADAESSDGRIDYIGIGAVRATASKTDAPAPRGSLGVAELARTTRLPAVAIGGVTPGDLPALQSGGLAGAAVVSWICASADPFGAASALRQAWSGPT